MELTPGRRVTRGAVCLFFAVEAEARPFRRRWVREKPNSSAEVTVVVTGMGATNAARVATAALSGAAAPAMVLTCGFAGGLDPRHPRGTVGFEADEEFPVRQRLIEQRVGLWRFYCSERVAVTPAEKAAIYQRTGADAVEMESAVIRRLARERGIPAATIRVISDAAGEALPLNFNVTLTPNQRLSPWRLVGQIVRSPAKIPELIRFGRRTAEAADRLAAVLVATLKDPG